MKRAPILTSRILEKTVAAICKKKKNRTRIITISLEQMEEKKRKILFRKCIIILIEKKTMFIYEDERIINVVEISFVRDVIVSFIISFKYFHILIIYL